MEIILLEKIHNLGSLGDVVKVRNGFARNFLIPQGKAKRATTANLKEFETRRADLEQAQAAALREAQARAEKVNGITLHIAQKAGVDGKLFGSVTNVDIMDALKREGVEIAKSSIRMPQGPLKQIGEHPITLQLHSDILATITVTVVAEA
jgi:large subunit ribosomal protein L9